MIWIVFGLVCFAFGCGFVWGIAYGVRQESEAEIQRKIRMARRERIR